MSIAPRLALAGFLLAVAASQSSAQNLPDPIDTFGRTVIRSEVGIPPSERAAAQEIAWKLFATPSFVEFDGGNVAAASLRAVRGKHTLTLQTSSIAIDNVDGTLTSNKLEYSNAVFGNDKVAVDATVSFTDVEHSSQTAEVALGVSRSIMTGGVGGIGAVDLVGSLAWATRDPDNAAASKVDDLKAAIGLQWVANPKLILAAEYAAKNDFDGESLWGVRAVLFKQVIIAYEEGQTWVAAFRLPLN